MDGLKSQGSGKTLMSIEGKRPMDLIAMTILGEWPGWDAFNSEKGPVNKASYSQWVYWTGQIKTLNLGNLFLEEVLTSVQYKH